MSAEETLNLLVSRHRETGQIHGGNGDMTQYEIARCLGR